MSDYEPYGDNELNNYTFELSFKSVDLLELVNALNYSWNLMFVLYILYGMGYILLIYIICLISRKVCSNTKRIPIRFLKLF